MSRGLNYNEGMDVSDIMAIGRWQRNSETTLKSKRGQQFLQDLEAALLAMPAKKLLYEMFYQPETGETCALGAYALAKGCSLEQLQQLELDGGEEQAYWVAGEYSQAHTLTWNIIDLNDSYRHETDEQRYERVLKWVQGNLHG